MKSPPSRGSDAPHVHPRLRKHLSRCTLDCGFKTPESPALRGFEAERGPITGTSLYLVLKSNGLHHSENFPVKFGFSSKTVPANIAKKLPPLRCFKPLLIAIFNFPHKRPTFAFTGESGYTLGFRRRIAHSGLHAETGGVSDGGGITTLDVFRTQSKRPVPACPNDSFAVFRGWAAIIDSSAAKYVPFPAGTGLSHPNSPGSLLRKGTGAVFLHHFRERAKNVAICALVQVAFGSNLPPPTPVVMPFSTAHATACA